MRSSDLFDVQLVLLTSDILTGLTDKISSGKTRRKELWVMNSPQDRFARNIFS